MSIGMCIHFVHLILTCPSGFFRSIYWSNSIFRLLVSIFTVIYRVIYVSWLRLTWIKRQRRRSVVLRECPEGIRAFPSEVGIARTTDLTVWRVETGFSPDNLLARTHASTCFVRVAGTCRVRWSPAPFVFCKDWWRWGRKLPQRHSHHLSQSARLIIICRLGTCVRSSNLLHLSCCNAFCELRDL
jgi:hypothetical protein